MQMLLAFALLVVSWSAFFCAPASGVPSLSTISLAEVRTLPRDVATGDVSIDGDALAERSSFSEDVKRTAEPLQYYMHRRARKWHNKWHQKHAKHAKHQGQNAGKHADKKATSLQSSGKVTKNKKGDKHASNDDGADSNSDVEYDGDNSKSATNTDISSGLPQFAKGKLGLVWAMDEGLIRNYQRQAVSWWYNWQAVPRGENYPKDLTFCSMLWGEKNLGEYIENVVKKPNEGANKGKCTLGMNEPNLGAQSGMSPRRACELQRQYQIPLKEQHGFAVGSPGVANGDTGLKWMKEFQSTCPDVFEKLDFVAGHYYDTSIDGFKRWMTTLSGFGKPILITELAAYSFSGRRQMDVGGVSGFMKQAVGWAVGNDKILGVGWTGLGNNDIGNANKFFGNNGKPNSLFNTFVGLAGSSRRRHEPDSEGSKDTAA